MSLQQAQLAKERAKQRRQLTEQAIRQATQGNWEEAVETNQRLIAVFDQDVDAHNRLGKALMEMGRYRAARDAYAEAARIDPNNSIARKNLARLEALAEALPEEGEAARERVDPRIFIEETGKTGHTNLVRMAPAAALARLTAGDQVHFRIEGRSLQVVDARGEYLGEIGPPLSLRLIEFMNGGNEYAAAITSLGENQVNIIIKEMLQHPSQVGKISFPAKTGETFRGYMKDTLIERERDFDEDLLESDDYTGTWRSDDEEEEEEGAGPRSEIETYDEDEDEEVGPTLGTVDEDEEEEM